MTVMAVVFVGKGNETITYENGRSVLRANAAKDVNISCRVSSLQGFNGMAFTTVSVVRDTGKIPSSNFIQYSI